ncbi:MAG: ABC transporter permease [Candidatus Micrarchaeia archaeon]
MIWRNAIMLLLIIFLPVALGMVFATFKEVIPKSTPASVIRETPEVSEADVRFATFSILSHFCSPSVDSRDDAFKKLAREESYFVVSVPAGIREGGGVVRVYVDNSLTPVAEVSDYVVEVLKYELGQVGFKTEIVVEKVGRRVMPIEYFAPGVVLLILSIAGLLVVPFNTVKEREVVPRVLSSVTITQFIASKLIFSFLLALLQVAVFFITENILELPVMSINYLSFFAFLLTSLALTSTGLLIVFAMKLSSVSRHLCSLIFGVVVAFSGAVYPPGFLPPYLQSISKVIPTYYALTLLRSFAVKGADVGIFVDYVAIVIVWFVLSFILLYYFIKRFKDG